MDYPLRTHNAVDGRGRGLGPSVIPADIEMYRK